MKNNLVKRYVQKIKQDFPELTESELSDVINNTFKYFRKRMGEEDIPNIRIKGFGSFQIFAAPILKEINLLENRIKNNTTKQLQYTKDKLNKLKKYVEENKELFDRYYERKKKHS